MVTVKSLITEFFILVLLLGPAMFILSPTDAAVPYGNNAPAKTHDPSSGGGAPLLYDKTALSDVQAGAVVSQASREWVMQSATIRNRSQGSAAVSTNATRIVVPAAGAQNTVGAGAPSAQSPAFSAWLWALIPITVSVVLAAIFILRTIFEEDEEQTASKTVYDSGEGASAERDEKRGARPIPIKGSDEPRGDVGARKDSNGRSTTRIYIDDAEPEDRISDDTEEN